MANRPISSRKNSLSKKFFLQSVGGLGLIIMAFFLFRTLTPKISIPNASPTNPVTPSKVDPTLKFVNVIPLEEGSKPGWKKYTNTKQGYSIEFPSTYTNSTMSVRSLELYDRPVNSDTGSIPSRYSLRISIYGPENVNTQGEFKDLRSYIKRGQAIDSGITEVTWTKINGYDVAVEGDPKYNPIYYFFNKGHIYRISKSSTYGEVNEEFMQIISTFKFE